MIKYIMNIFPLKSVRLKIGITKFTIFSTYFYVHSSFWVFPDSKVPAETQSQGECWELKAVSTEPAPDTTELEAVLQV